MIWTAVGGRGTIIGPFIGACLVKGAEFFLSGVLEFWWQLIIGGLFVFVVLVMRDGIVGTVAHWLRRRPNDRNGLNIFLDRSRGSGLRCRAWALPLAFRRPSAEPPRGRDVDLGALVIGADHARR